MQQSRRGIALFWPLLSLGCGGFEPRNFGSPPPQHDAAGIAGFSYDAGTAEAGRVTTSPPRRSPSCDWEPVESSGGEGGAPAEPGGPWQPGEVPNATGGAGEARGQGGERDASHAGGGRASAGGGAHDGGASGRGAVAGTHGGGAGSGGSAGRAGAAGHAGVAGHVESGGGGAGGATSHERTLLFSEYVEGSGSYKALELHALESSALDGCLIETYANGSSSPRKSARVALIGELGAGETYVICSSSLSEQLGTVCDLTEGLSFNGDDAVTLECDGVVVDTLGQVGFDPGMAWSAAGVGTVNQTLRRRCSITRGDPIATDAFEPSVEWQSHPTDDFSGLGSPDCDP